MKINFIEIEILYEYALKFYKNEITISSAVKAVDKFGINKNTSIDYLYNLSHLLNGRIFTRTMNVLSTKYYLEKIHEDFGSKTLKNALQALSLHIDYYEEITGGNVIKLKGILNEYLDKYQIEVDNYYEEDIPLKMKLTEGLTKSIRINIYERNPLARKKCIEHYGSKCIVCGFDFEQKYGELGRKFIHIHHVIEISSIGKEYEVDYINDLVPVCPNCHAMLHKKKPALTIDELKKILKDV
jgi:5-methylcytosine-specific restriction protein A